MAYENRTVQNSVPNALPNGTDPLVDNTAAGDVQAIKILDPTAGSTTPMIGQKARTGSMPVALATEDAALLATLLTEATFGATDFATSAKQDALATLIGAVNETAPANDTAASGLNGRLQRIAQRLTSLLPASIGQKAKAASLAVTLASDDDLLARIGEVQASPTTNTLLDRLKTIATALGGTLAVSGTVGVSGNVEVTNDVGNPLPVSGTVTANIGTVGTLATAAKQPALGTAGTPSADVLTVQGVAAGTALPVSQRPATSGGLSSYRNLDANATGANVKSSAGQLYGYYLYNNAASVRYVKFYDKATTPTVGTDTPKLTIPIPAGAAANVSFPDGVAFALGIGVGATTAIADSSTAAPSTNDVVVDLFYA